MAKKIAVIGPVNSGKSMARRNLNPEEVFVLAPSKKMLHLKEKDGSELKPLDISTKQSKGINNVIKSLNKQVKQVTNPETLLGYLASKREAFLGKDILDISGSWMICSDMSYLSNCMTFIRHFMPEKKIINVPDFTHYISNRIRSPHFRSRSKGGEAYARFWDMADDALTHFIQAAEKLPDDMIVITEYHAEYDENIGEYKIFVNAGKMLEEKFKPESYYDFIFYTHIEPDADGEIDDSSYKFVTKRWRNYPARSAGLFEDTLIPNDLAPVVEKVREHFNLISKPKKSTKE